MPELKTYYGRHLPHYQPPGYTFFVTFRLAGSLPAIIIQKLKAEKEEQLKHIAEVKNKKEKFEKYQDHKKKYFEKFDSFLDKYKDSPHWLKQDNVAERIKYALHFRDNKEYDLIAYTIMPNHVHIVFTPIIQFVGRDSSRPNKQDDMHFSTHKPIVTEILRKLKGSTSRECNKILNRSGAFWQHESYDHVIRDENDLNRIVEYILNNPVKAGLVETWEEWKWNYYKYNI